MEVSGQPVVSGCDASKILKPANRCFGRRRSPSAFSPRSSGRNAIVRCRSFTGIPERLLDNAQRRYHARQEQVWRDLAWNKSAEMIRRLLTQAHVPATDRRAIFVRLDACEGAGGAVLRDLFSDDERGGYLEDVALLTGSSGRSWRRRPRRSGPRAGKWVEVHAEFAYGMAAGLRRVYPQLALTEDEQARLNTLEQEHEALSVRYDGQEETPEIAAEFDRLETEIDALRGREAYDPQELSRAGVFVCLGHDGAARIERASCGRKTNPFPSRPRRKRVRPFPRQLQRRRSTTRRQVRLPPRRSRRSRTG